MLQHDAVAHEEHRKSKTKMGNEENEIQRKKEELTKIKHG